MAKKSVFNKFLGHFDIKITLFLLEISLLCKRIPISGLLAPKKMKDMGLGFCFVPKSIQLEAIKHENLLL